MHERIDMVVAPERRTDMAEIVILDFEGVGEADYDAINEKLGIDPVANSGDWPAGMRSHISGWDDDGNFHVIEVWDSREAQGEFMNSRLGPAFGATGVAAPKKITWATQKGDHGLA